MMAMQFRHVFESTYSNATIKQMQIKETASWCEIQEVDWSVWFAEWWRFPHGGETIEAFSIARAGKRKRSISDEKWFSKGVIFQYPVQKPRSLRVRV